MLPSYLPKAFIQKMERLMGDEANEFFASYAKERAAGLRINPLKIDEEEWKKINPFSLTSIPYIENGYYYPHDNEEPGKHPYHFAGLYYIQEPSAMFVVEQLDIKPGEKILDLCAAPGGKSTQIAAKMKGQGLLVSNEIHPKRAKILSENIERLGIQNAIVVNETPKRLTNTFTGYFDKILVDAPCSGEGMFRKDPGATQYWSEEHVRDCSLRQIDILEHAYTMLKEGGILVYSTCTFSPEENEQVIERFLENYPDMELLDIEKPRGVANGRVAWAVNGNPDIAKCARLWPHLLHGEGHFVAKLMKTSPAPVKRTETIKPIKNRNRIKDFLIFADEYLQNISFANYQLFGTQLYALPDDCPDLNGLKVLRCGLHLGEMKKNRFEPNHALALALKKEHVKQWITISTHENAWLDYLKGMTLPGTGKYSGWVLVTIDGFSLGWGKEANGTLKNYYPKGLRIHS